jgi:serine-type D-Ala-D-Ala carboxypeptidase/endopeptidase (penicillin-binding protein 4)
MNRTPVPLQLHPFQGLSFLFALVSVVSLPDASVARKHHSTRTPTLDDRIESILNETKASRGLWGIEVARLSEGNTVYARNAGHLFLPASNMKLFTTATALETLGPGFIFRTTVESEMPPDARGRVGDLFLVGRGDPNLSGRALPYQFKQQRQDPADRALQDLAAQAAAKGVREVQGNLIADDSYFLDEPYSRDWAADDLEWGYGAPVTALAFNDNSLFLHILPGQAVGEAARVWLDPIPDYYQLHARVATTPGNSEKRLLVERRGESRKLDVWGEMPIGSDEDEETVALVNPPQLIGELFRRALLARGITVRGWVDVRHLSRLEAAAMPQPAAQTSARVVLAEHDSLPLPEDIKVINKVSQNLHAEMLLRTMGRELKNSGSISAGLDVVQEFTARAGLEPGETRFADGSGLSREDLVAPHAIITLLKFMANQPNRDIFFDSLPVAGVDGTLGERFKGSPAGGRIHAKTGTMTYVNALSGYMDLPSGQRIVFSIVGNSHALGSKEGEQVIDRIATAIYEDGAVKRGR